MKIAKYYQQYSATEFHMLKNGFHFSKKKMTVSRTSMSIDRCKPHTILKTKCQNMRNTIQKINYKKTNNLFLYTLWYLEKQIVFVIFSFYFVILLTKFNNVFFFARSTFVNASFILFFWNLSNHPLVIVCIEECHVIRWDVINVFGQ